MVRVRFAPSPTGFLHIGSVRTALFNYLFARHHGGSFILRIEDTDRERSKEEYLKEILADLSWLGLSWDEGPGAGGDLGPYFQSERLSFYQEYANRLETEGKAYPCFCTPEELLAQRELARETKQAPGYSGKCRQLSPEKISELKGKGVPYVLRFKVPPGQTQIDDLIRGQVVFDNSEVRDFVILKSDGFPVYNFAAVVDDYLMKITHVIRGEEHLSNTPGQIMLYRALEFKLPQFAHLPIILDEQKRKLSKRTGGQGVELPDFIKRGFLPEAIFNFLALLGWCPGEDRELLTKEELIREFSLAGVSKHPAGFDQKKLLWMNSLYLKNSGAEKLAGLSAAFFESAGLKAGKAFRLKLCELYLERVKTLQELVSESEYFFKEVSSYDEQALNKYLTPPEAPENLKLLAGELSSLEDFSREKIEAALRALAERLGLSAARLIHPARVAITGKAVSPGLFEIMELLGREDVAKRLRKLAELYQERAGSL